MPKQLAASAWLGFRLGASQASALVGTACLAAAIALGLPWWFDLELALAACLDWLSWWRLGFALSPRRMLEEGE